MKHTVPVTRALVAVAARPRLWPVAVVAARNLVPHRWWRRPPFLPLPDAAWWRFRVHTAFGADRRPQAGDVVEFLEWCQRTRQWRR